MEERPVLRSRTTNVASMASFAKSLKCTECGKEYSPAILYYACKNCGGPLEIQYDYAAISAQLSREKIRVRRAQTIEKWIEFLPIEDKAHIEMATLGETTTPLLECRRLATKVRVRKLYVKNDSAFPTGSFKDRSMPLAVIKALEVGAKTLAIVSSGNAAASLGAHAARAGLRAVAFVDEEVPSSKLAQLLMYGVKAVVLKADYSTIMELFIAARDKFGWYDCDAECNPFRFEGNKTCSYEICDQLDWKIPDWFVSPMGTCTGIAAQWKGFKELVATGIVDAMPHLAGVQAEACSPVVNAFRKRRDTIEPTVPGHTIATAIKITNPFYGRRALQALYESKGAAETATDEEMIDAIKLLAKEGIFSEPAGAASLAATIRLVENGEITHDEEVVCVLTGHGLKTPEVAARIFQRPPAIEPRIDEIERTLDSSS